MANRLLQEGIPREKIRIIENWADGAVIVPLPPQKNELRKSWGLEDRFVVGYAGNLGRAHDLDTVVEAMTLLQGRATDEMADRVTFLFVGGGAQFPKLEREILQRQLRNVSTRPYQPQNRLAETLAVADLHLVSLNPELEGLIFPSKFYGVAASGRPILFIGAADGEIARLIDEAECGFTVRPGHAKDLLDRVLQLAVDRELCARMGQRARVAFERNWAKAHALQQWEEVIAAAARKPASANRAR
jgi:glycosyltransferase involved in cell wall biosynthesis